MKINKLLYSMQIVATVPLIFFIFIYTNQHFIYMLIAIILLVLLGYNFYRYKKHRRVINYPLLIVLVGSYLLYAFYGLGNIHSPKTFERLDSKNSKALFLFTQPTQIDKVCYYMGIDENVKFDMKAYSNSKWNTLLKYDENFPYSFRWRCADVSVKTSKIELAVTKEAMTLHEVRFLYKDKLQQYCTTKQNLNDEPHTTIDLSYHGGMFFDEIYHGRTAFELLHGLEIYETTHPYVGKLLIIPGIKLFGMTPFGWRFMNVVFGALFIFLMYYFALLIFKKRLYAFSAAFLITYSFMHLTQSRIALIDTFGVFFVFVSYYFLYYFIKQQKLFWLLLSGLFFGLASAVKWAAVFASVGFIFIALYLLITRYPLEKRFSGYRLILYGILSYVGIAVSVYILSFYDLYLRTGSLQAILDYQYNMYDYHSALKDTHAYSSAWWSWPVNYRPMCYYREIHGDRFSSITVFGNPIIFWSGIVSVFYLIYLFFRKRTLEASFILLAFLGLFLPYAIVGRVMFIYHFYYALPFLILSLVYMLKDSMHYFKKFHYYYLGFFLLVSILFLMFYPVLSGYEVNKAYVDHWLIWFSGWWL